MMLIDIPRETQAFRPERDSGRRESPPRGDSLSAALFVNIANVSYSRPTAGQAGCEVCGEDVRPGGVSGCGSNRVRLPTLGNRIGENQALAPLGNPQ